ncbi:MAG: hypothetical protein DMG99_10660 [Acidobacteria bacterium]|nr:MAG: hypothetical protein DMG99_10660 [Acidobacteriota bacterium]
MKAWSTALAAELREWPQVTQKSFFGFTALYRGKTMFGLLPRTRSIFKGNAVAFRINAENRSLQCLIEKDPRISAFDKDKARWFTFELSRDTDLHDALDYLGRAFAAARNSKKKK